jgi:hypothetical protein
MDGWMDVEDADKEMGDGQYDAMLEIEKDYLIQVQLECLQHKDSIEVTHYNISTNFF